MRYDHSVNSDQGVSEKDIIVGSFGFGVVFGVAGYRLIKREEMVSRCWSCRWC